MLVQKNYLVCFVKIVGREGRDKKEILKTKRQPEVEQ